MTTDATTTQTADRPLRVLGLEAENFMRLRAVRIAPDGDVVVVGGRNAQGKSSLLDAIWATFQNAAAARAIPQPIRDGEDTARVRLDLGDLIVTRTWSVDHGTRLTVESPTGARYRSPQTILDTLVGPLSFDPLAFVRASEKEQVTQLLALLNLDEDPADIDRRRAAVFEERTGVNRDVRQLAARLAGMPEDPGAPASEISIGEALDELRRAEEAVAVSSAQQSEATRMADRLDEIDRQITELEAERERVGTARFELLSRLASADTLPDVEALRARIGDIESLNERARKAEQRRKVTAEHAAAEAHAAKLTEDIRCLDETRRTLLAEAEMPLPGLAFADDAGGLTYSGVPLRQCSSAEQIRVAVAVAMATDPRLRVLRVKDGSLLDEDSMGLLAELAAEYGFQVWVERVGGDGAGIVIEDGEVVTPAGEAVTA